MKVINYNGRTALTDDKGNLYRVVPRRLNDMAEAVIAVGRGRGGKGVQVATEGDWKTIEALIRIFAKFFPAEYQDFLSQNAKTRSMQLSKFGEMVDKSSDQNIYVRQLGTWPFELEAMIKVIWPDQKFDQKFNRKFFTKFTLFKTTDKI